MKRFTEALKWRDPWFRGLSVDGKLVFFYLVDNCDAAGVWEPDFALANFCLKRDVDWDAVLHEFGDRIVTLQSGKWWLRKFVEFQYGKLTESCAPHRTVIALVLRHGLVIDKGSVRVTEPYQNPPPGVKEKEKEKDMYGRGTGETIPAQSELLVESRPEADTRHYEISSRWGALFEGAFGAKYQFTGRDASALKRFLVTVSDSSEEIMAVAVRAWERTKQDRYAKRCKEAATVHGLCTFYNEIRVELKTPTNNANDSASNGRGFSQQQSYVGITNKL